MYGIEQVLAFDLPLSSNSLDGRVGWVRWCGFPWSSNSLECCFLHEGFQWRSKLTENVETGTGLGKLMRGGQVVCMKCVGSVPVERVVEAKARPWALFLHNRWLAEVEL